MRREVDHCLQECYAKKGKSWNFISMKGGRFLIPLAKRDTFLEAHCEAVPTYDENHYNALVFRPLPKSVPGPVFLDIDLEMAADNRIDTELFIKFAEMVAFELWRLAHEVFEVIIGEEVCLGRLVRFAAGSHRPHVVLEIAFLNTNPFQSCLGRR